MREQFLCQSVCMNEQLSIHSHSEHVYILTSFVNCQSWEGQGGIHNWNLGVHINCEASLPPPPPHNSVYNEVYVAH